MAPFLSLRAIEQIKCGPGLMNLPISIISTGIGLGYADAGPTHYSTEDLACLRSISGNTIYTPSDNNLVKLIVSNLLNNPEFSYIRLDRDMLPDIYSELTIEDFNNGFKIIGDTNNKDICLVSHGKMFHKCIEIQKNNKNLFCVDLFRSKPVSKNLVKVLSNCKKIICVDEQMPAGNLSSIISETFMDTELNPKVLNVSLKEEYLFENGGREYLLDKYGLSIEDIINKLK
jgi:transketolase